MSTLTEDQLKEAFVIFGDNAGSPTEALATIDSSTISTDKVGIMMRSLGQNPTQAEVAELVKEMGDTMDFSDFSSLMAKRGAGVNSEAELVESFRVFDKDGNGFVSTAEVKMIMCNVGENLQEDEIDDMVREIDPDGEGQVNYVNLVKIMLDTEYLKGS